MTLLTELPPELLIQILSSVGWSMRTYTSKACQGQLFNFALVHSTFLPPAQYLLYTSNLTIRNAGRASLLARTLTSCPSLSALVRHISVDSTQSNHPPSLIAILENTSLHSLTLNGPLMDSGAGAGNRLQELLLTRVGETIRSFSWEGYAEQFWQGVVPLLRRWEGLQELALEVDLVEWDVERAGPKPSYQLRSLTVVPEPLVSAALHWMTGDTRALKSLQLGTSSSPPEAIPIPQWREVASLLGLSKALLHSPSPLLDHLTTLRLFPRAMSHALLQDIFTRTTHLRHFSFGVESFTVAPQSPIDVAITPLLPPSSLQSLTLHRHGLAKELGLAEMLASAESRPEGLRAISLLGHFPTDEEAREVARVCKEIGVELEVRPF